MSLFSREWGDFCRGEVFGFGLEDNLEFVK